MSAMLSYLVKLPVAAINAVALLNMDPSSPNPQRCPQILIDDSKNDA